MFFFVSFLSIKKLIPTIIMNTEYCREHINNNLRFINWGPRRVCDEEKLKYIDQCGNR